MTAVWPEDVGWRVRSGAGLLEHAPLGDALRDANVKEDERERQRAELQAQLRVDASIERVAELQRQGVEPHSVGEFLSHVAAADAKEQRLREHRLDKGLPVVDKDAFGIPVELPGADRGPRPYVAKLAEAKGARLEREAEAATTPATVAEAKGLQRQIDNLKIFALAVTGKKPW